MAQSEPEPSRVECSVTFLPAIKGGRSSPPTTSGGVYRPTLVTSDPTGRIAGTATADDSADDHFGVAFLDGPAIAAADAEIVAVLLPLFRPMEMYDRFPPGSSFTVREGRRIVGYGVVRRWLR